MPTCTGLMWQTGVAVSGRLLCFSLRHRQSSATTFCTSLSADRTTPSTYCNTLGRRAFVVARSTVWNSLPDQLRDPDCIDSAFRRALKTFFLSTRISVFSACVRGVYDYVLYLSTFYLLTVLPYSLSVKFILLIPLHKC